jgi:hypothetical protein
MATISKTGIATGQNITADHTLNIIEALDGTDTTDINIKGTLTLPDISDVSASLATALASSGGSFTAAGISGSLGTNATLIRSLTAAGITGSFNAASSSFSTRVTANELVTAKALLSSSAQIASDISGAFQGIASDFDNINATSSFLQSGILFDDKKIATQTTYNITSSDNSSAGGISGDNILIQAGGAGQYPTALGGNVTIKGGKHGTTGAVQGGNVILLGGEGTTDANTGKVLINSKIIISGSGPTSDNPTLRLQNQNSNNIIIFSSGSNESISNTVAYVGLYSDDLRLVNNLEDKDIIMLMDGDGAVGIETVSPTGGSYDLSVNGNADKGAGGTTWGSFSDRRLKTNIQTASLDICYDLVKNLPLKRFTWDNTHISSSGEIDRSQLGWIAQEVTGSFPKAVTSTKYVSKTIYTGSEATTDSNGQVVNPGDIIQDATLGSMVIDDMLVLQADQIFKTLYGAVQKLQIKVEALEAQISGSS